MARRTFHLLTMQLCALVLLGCVEDGQAQSADQWKTIEPTAPVAEEQIQLAQAEVPNLEKAAVYKVKFETSKGDFVVEVHPEWAPLGAARFKELVEQKFYDDVRFFRVIDGFMVQFGMNGDPKVNAGMQNNKIKDDPNTQSNTRGMITFATSGPNSRTSQVFINFGNNSFLDRQGFSPFGKIVEGMDVVDSLYKGYGEGAPSGTGPSQDSIRTQGNKYLNEKFPKLDYVKKATVLKE